jgi:Lar family restriction alleviation protein
MTATVPTLTECPFCGGKAMLHPDGWVDGSWPFVECLDCHADSPCARTDAEAIANWNRRASRSGGVVVGPLKLDNDRQVFFYEQDHYYLSNFSAFTLRWRKQKFATSEHAYHWAKFPVGSIADGVYVRDAILDAKSAHEAFKLAEKWRHLRHADWDEIKVGVMRDILRAKAEQHEYVSRKLIQTGDRELIENSWRDDFWGWGHNRDGQNMLGKLWMEIRAELLAASGGKG